MQKRERGWAELLLAALGALLFVDLFLTWHSTSVSVIGLVGVDTDASAWAGWGAVAGILLAALLVWELVRGAPLVSAWLAIGAAVFTAIEFFAGTVSTVVGPGVLVDVHGRQWSAYAGLVLAVLLAFVSVLVLERPAERRGRLEFGVK